MGAATSKQQALSTASIVNKYFPPLRFPSGPPVQRSKARPKPAEPRATAPSGPPSSPQPGADAPAAPSPPTDPTPTGSIKPKRPASSTARSSAVLDRPSKLAAPLPPPALVDAALPWPDAAAPPSSVIEAGWVAAMEEEQRHQQQEEDDTGMQGAAVKTPEQAEGVGRQDEEDAGAEGGEGQPQQQASAPRSLAEEPSEAPTAASGPGAEARPTATPAAATTDQASAIAAAQLGAGESGSSTPTPTPPASAAGSQVASPDSTVRSGASEPAAMPLPTPPATAPLATPPAPSPAELWVPPMPKLAVPPPTWSSEDALDVISSVRDIPGGSVMTLAQPVTVPRQPSVAERKKGGGGVVSGGAAGGNAVVQGVADALAPLGLQLTPVRGGGSSFNRGGLGRDFDARVVVCPRGGVAVARGAGREVVMRVQLDSAKFLILDGGAEFAGTARRPGERAPAPPAVRWSLEGARVALVMDLRQGAPGAALRGAVVRAGSGGDDDSSAFGLHFTRQGLEDAEAFRALLRQTTATYIRVHQRRDMYELGVLDLEACGLDLGGDVDEALRYALNCSTYLYRHQRDALEDVLGRATRGQLGGKLVDEL